jgi:glycosyltransferase involved in cell wall biosynthesis
VWAPLLRRWDLMAAQQPDHYIAISDRVRRRIETYYRRRADCVIYPPVETTTFLPKRQTSKAAYYLLVSRLVPYKRPDIVIAAANRLRIPLIVIGSGSEYPRLKKMASKTVRFITKDLTDKELARYYQDCRAFLFAGEEDFGIVAAEAQSVGKAVIAYRESGVAEIVVDGKTGVLFDEQTPEGLMQAIRKFEQMHISAAACRHQAEKFSTKRFKE